RHDLRRPHARGIPERLHHLAPRNGDSHGHPARSRHGTQPRPFPSSRRNRYDRNREDRRSDESCRGGIRRRRIFVPPKLRRGDFPVPLSPAAAPTNLELQITFRLCSGFGVPTPRQCSTHRSTIKLAFASFCSCSAPRPSPQSPVQISSPTSL